MGKKLKKNLEEDKFDEPDCHTGLVDSKKNNLNENMDCDNKTSKLNNKHDKANRKKQRRPSAEVNEKQVNISSLSNLEQDSQIKKCGIVGKDQSEKREKKKQTDSSAQEDYDFIKFHLDMIPANVLMDSETLQDDSESSEDEYTDTQSSGKSPIKKLKVTSGEDKVKINCVAKMSLVEDETSQGTYTKIKEKMKHKKNKKKSKKESKVKDTSDIPGRREMLREKLLGRIEELKGKRNLTSDEVLEKKKLRRKESKLKLKMRRKEEKKKGNVAKPNINGDIPDKKPAVTPVKDKSGKMVFSKFDFVDSGDKDLSQSNLKGKDYKRLLEKVEKKKEKIEKLKETNPEAAKSVVSKDAWKKVLMMAEGEKVKDDPTLLKKSLKKKEKFKEKRKKQWDERTSQTEHRMKVQQDKRQKNIMSRKQAKVDKKIKRAKKKGRMVPGF